MRRLRLIAAVSGIYDGSIGLALLLMRPQLAHLAGIGLPTQPIHADLNGVFLLAIAAGYLMPFRDPVRGRFYLWVMGPLLKGAGAAVFVLDHLVRHSPSTFLLFAASDGGLAVVTLWALVTAASTSRPADRPRSR